MAKVVERRGLNMEDLGSNLGGIFFLLLSTGCTSGTKRPRVIVIFEASDVTRVCPYMAKVKVDAGYLCKHLIAFAIQKLDLFSSPPFGISLTFSPILRPSAKFLSVECVILAVILSRK